MPGEFDDLLRDAAAEPPREPEAWPSRFVRGEELGHGAMSIVYKAHDQQLQREVALKLLRPDLEVDPDAVLRFKREAEAAARLSHPHVVTLFDAGARDGRMFLVMEFIRGETLHRRLQRSYDLRAMLEVVEKVARGVHHAHENGILHRDLKPSNILLGESGEPKVADFGMALLMGAGSALTESGVAIGTPAYMSPEQAEGRARDITVRTDVYALGALLYQVATGLPPHSGASIPEIIGKVVHEDPVPPRIINPATPRDIEAIALKAIEKDPAQRYESAAAFSDDLRRHLDGREILARPPSRLQRFVRRRARTVAIVIVLFAATGVAFSLRPSPSPDAAWRQRLEPLKGPLAYYSFRGRDTETVNRAQQVLADMPVSLRGETLRWFDDQRALVPNRWPKTDWYEHRTDAQRILAWCSTVREVLGGNAALAEMEKVFAPVAAYRGRITLELFFHPAAPIKSLRVGGEWIIRDGTKHTPMVIRDLDIGSYLLEVGAETITPKSDELVHGGRYICSGSLDNPASIRIRPSP